MRSAMTRSVQRECSRGLSRTPREEQLHSLMSCRHGKGMLHVCKDHPSLGITSSAWRQLASGTQLATQVLNQNDALDSRGSGCLPNTIRYDVFTEYYRILSTTVKSAPLGAKALLTASKTSCKLACMSSCISLFIHWPQLFKLKFNP